MDYTPWFILVKILNCTMDMNRYFESYKSTAEQLINQAANYTEAEFSLAPAEEQWSMSEMYRHIVLVTEKCLDNVDSCREGNGKRQKFAFGPALFSLMGSFPPIKLRIKKVTESVKHIYNPEAITISEAVAELQASINKMEQYQAVVKNTDKHLRIEHWAGGWFTAAQWYQSAEMHIRHHLRQKKRIDAFLKKK